jgi:hypothetical protein
MELLPQHDPQRSPRIELGEGIPAVLRHPNGICKQAALRKVSLTGGLLNVPRGLEEGSQCRLMFVTHTGPVLGTAELLNPTSFNTQPFRFISLHQNDRRKLGAAITSVLEPNLEREIQEREWMEKYRAAILVRDQPKKNRFKTVLFAATFATASLLSVFYLLHAYLR